MIFIKHKSVGAFFLIDSDCAGGTFFVSFFPRPKRQTLLDRRKNFFLFIYYICVCVCMRDTNKLYSRRSREWYVYDRVATKRAYLGVFQMIYDCRGAGENTLLLYYISSAILYRNLNVKFNTFIYVHTNIWYSYICPCHNCRNLVVIGATVLE